MKILALGLAGLALLPAPALANIEYSLGGGPIFLTMGASGALEAMPDFSSSVEADGVHVFFQIQTHHRYGTFGAIYEGSCASLGARPVFAGGMASDGQQIKSGSVSGEWMFQNETLKNLVSRYCDVAN